MDWHEGTAGSGCFGPTLPTQLSAGFGGAAQQPPGLGQALWGGLRACAAPPGAGDAWAG